LTTLHLGVKLSVLAGASAYPRGVRFSKKLTRVWALSTAADVSQVLKYLGTTNPGSRVDMNALILHVDEYGFHPSSKRYRHIEGPIVELKVKKPKAIRVLAYRLPSNGHVLLLGYDKGDGPIPSATLSRAKDLARQFEEGGMQLD
jgi:hypothetical protein